MKNLMFLLLPGLVLLGSCDPDDPEKENVEETITKVTLSFQAAGGGAPIVVVAEDPDGDGPQDLVADEAISLENNVEYSLSIKFENTLETPAEDITEEVEEEGDEHIILFGWTNDVFEDPDNGNIETNRTDIRYDDGAEEIGLSTLWTTVDGTATGTFRVVLKHQPDGLKTPTSGIDDGTTDVDVTFDIEVGK